MTKATNEFRRCINEAKELHVRQIERIQRERDAALLAARVHGDVDDPNNIANQIQGVDMPAAKKVSFFLFTKSFQNDLFTIFFYFSVRIVIEKL